MDTAHYKLYEPIARPLVAVLFSSQNAVQPVEDEIEDIVGPILARSPTFPFSHSHYYTQEMGPDLKKYYLVSKTNILPQEIIRIKHRTSQLEARYLTGQGNQKGRMVNIDPGYFTHSQLVLATHKNYAHRVYLGDQVFAELTYLIQGKEWMVFPWTYPDYCRAETKTFFIKQRNIFVKETKELRPKPGSRRPMWQWSSDCGK